MSQEGTLNKFVIGVVVNGNEQLTELSNSLKRIKKLNADVDKSMGKPKTRNIVDPKITKQVDDMARSFKKAGAQIDGFDRQVRIAATAGKNELSDMFRRVTLWSTGIGVLFGTLSKLKELYSATLDLEVSMVELKKVMSSSTPFAKVKDDLFAAGKAFSISTKEVGKVATVWAQQGKNYKEVAQLTIAALLGVNSANLEAAESVEFLTSVTKAYNMEASKTVEVMDAIMNVQAHFAITARDLAKGFKIIGQTAALMGDDIGTAFGMITAIGEVTRESGNVVGTSLKTQIARINKPETLRYLEMRYGIKTTDVGTGHRANYRGLMQQIVEKDLSKEEKIDIAQKIGGVRKWKDVVALMEQWNVAESARMHALYSYNDAAKANALVQEELIKKVEKLGIVFEEMSSNVLNASVIPAIKLAIDGLTGIGHALTYISKSSLGSKMLGNIPLALGVVGMGRLVARGGMQTAFHDFSTRIEQTGSPIPTNGKFTATDIALGLNTSAAQKYAKENPIYPDQIAAMREAAKKEGGNIELRQRMADAQHALLVSEFSGLKSLSASAGVLRKSAAVFGRGLRAGFAESVGLRSLNGGATGKGAPIITAAGLSTSIGKFAGGLVKTSAIMLALDLVLTGVIKGFSALYHYFMDTVESAKIDYNSQMSKNFFELFDSLHQLSESSKTAADNITKYATYSEKERQILFGKSGENNESIADIIMRIKKRGENGKPTKDSIEYIYQLRDAFKSVGLDATDYAKTIEYLTTVWKYVDGEMLKGINGLREEAKKLKASAIEDVLFNADFNALKLSRVGLSLGGNGTKSSGENGNMYDLYIKQARVDSENAADSFIRNFILAYKEKIRKASENDALVMQTKLNHAFYDSGKIEKKWNNSSVFNFDSEKAIRNLYAIDPKTAQEVMQDYWVNYFNKNIEDVDTKAKVARADNIPAGKFDYKQFAVSQYEPSIDRWIDQIIAGSEDLQKFNQIVEKGKTNLGSKFEKFGYALQGVIKSLEGIYDPVYRAVVDLEKTIRHNKIKFDSRDITGVGFSQNEANYKAISGFYTKLQNIVVDLESQKKKLENNAAEYKAGINTEEVQKLIKTANEIARQNNLSPNDTTGMSKLLKESITGTKDQSLINAALYEIKQQAKIMKIDRLISIAKGDQGVNISDFAGIKESLKDLGVNITAFDEMVLKKASENGKKFSEALKEYRKGLLEERDKIAKINMASGYQDVINKTRESVGKLFNSGNRKDDIDRGYNIKISNINSKYDTLINQQKALQQAQITGNDVDYSSKINELEQKKKLAIETEKINYQTALLTENMTKARNATDNFVSALSDLLTNVNNYHADTKEGFASGIRNFISSVGGNAKKNIIDEMLQSALKYNKDNILGQLLTGLDIESPEEKLQNKMTDQINSMDLLKDSIDALDQTMRTYLGLPNQSNNSGTVEAASLLQTNDSGGVKMNLRGIFSTVGDFFTSIFQSEEQKKKSRDIVAQKVSPNPDSKAAKTDRAPAAEPDNGYDFDYKAMFAKTAAVMIGSYFSRGKLTGNKGADEVAQRNAQNTVSLVSMGAQMGASKGGWLGALIGAAGGFAVGKIMEEDYDNTVPHLKQIVENTAYLKDIDSRLFNAPSDFKIPALAKTGGNIQYTGGITININGSDNPQATAEAVTEALGAGVSNYNSISGI